MGLAVVLAFAGVVTLLSLLAWSLLADDEHLADWDEDETRAGEGPW